MFLLARVENLFLNKVRNSRRLKKYVAQIDVGLMHQCFKCMKFPAAPVPEKVIKQEMFSSEISKKFLYHLTFFKFTNNTSGSLFATVINSKVYNLLTQIHFIYHLLPKTKNFVDKLT